MAPLSLIMIGCAIVGLDMASAHTDTCSEEIARVALVNQSMGNPIAKPTTAQSVDAQLHHQPTPRSARTADENAQSMFAAILARAKALNADGKLTSASNPSRRDASAPHRMNGRRTCGSGCS